MCPGNNESAGKRRSGRTRRGSPWLRATLVEAAQAAARTRRTYLAAQCHRLAARRGVKRAAVALGHTLLVIAYHLLSEPLGEQATYRELGERHLDERDRVRTGRRLVGRLRHLGYRVSVSL